MLAVAQRSDQDSAVAGGREPAFDTRTARIEQLGREPARVVDPGEASTSGSPDGLSYVYCFLIVFSPTPGASGLAEGGGYVLFEAEAPAEVVGSYVVLWRFVSCYLVMVIGSLLFVRFLRRVHGRAALVGSTGDRCLP